MRIEIYYCQGKCSVRKKQGPLKIWNSRNLSFARKYKHSRECTITMEIQDDDEISTEKVGTSGHIYLLGVCGLRHLVAVETGDLHHQTGSKEKVREHFWRICLN